MPSSYTSSDFGTDARPRILTREESQALFQQVVGMTSGGGDVSVTVRSSWAGRIHWARNRPSMADSVTNHRVFVQRIIGRSSAEMEINELDGASLGRAVRQTEDWIRAGQAGPAPVLSPAQQYVAPPLWDEALATMTAQGRSEAAYASVAPVMQAKLMAAGYLETSVETWGIFNTRGLAAYAAATGGQYSETVRDPDAKASGWAGLSHASWAKLDIGRVSARALQKCRASANPIRVEPGRWTVVLEPEAVAHFLLPAVDGLRDRPAAERNAQHPYGKEGGSLIGERVFDERITISTNPADPDAPYIPFDTDGYPYRPVTWVEKGILKELPYGPRYAQDKLGTSVPLPIPYAGRMSGGDTSLDEMIATTERGLLVTRFGRGGEGNRVDLGEKRLTVNTVTMHGVWLIEKGKIKAPVVNLRVQESPFYVFNNVLQLGRPERVLGYGWTWNSGLDLESIPSRAVGNLFPMVVPPMKVRDFYFIALTDAV